MKSPLHVFVIRLTTNLLVFVSAGMLVYVTLPDLYPDLTTLWVALSLAMIIGGEAFLYSLAWKFGERDRNLVKYRHLTYMPKRGVVAGAIAAVMPVLMMFMLSIGSFTPVKVIYITVVALTPIATGVGYLNGHKLKTLGINIIYRKKKR